LISPSDQLRPTHCLLPASISFFDVIEIERKELSIDLLCELIAVQAYDQMPPMLCVVAKFKEVVILCVINALSTHRSLTKKRLWKHLPIAKKFLARASIYE
jgi:hypothetical protein